MIVQEVLTAKGSDVVTIEPGASVKDAADLLTRHNIGAVPVMDGGSIVGILSERDIVRQLAHQGSAVLARTVAESMTPNPFTGTPSTSVNELMERMTERRIRHIPIVEGGKLLGLVSIGDVVKWKIEEAQQEAASLRDYIAS